MKLLISTSQNAINYGAVLQAYAFGEYLKSLDINYFMLNYHEEHSLNFFPLNVSGIRLIVSNIYNNIFKLIHSFSTYQQIKRFEIFVKQNISLTREYRTIEDLKSNPPVADVYITGGDQMFNCHSGVGAQGFLNFGDLNIKRFSYATSMGLKEPPKQYLEEFINCINKYEVISLREESAKKFIDAHCSVKTQTNIDPVFLLSKSQWSELIVNQRRTHDKPYILVYQLLYHPLTMKLIDSINKKSKLDVVVLSASARNNVKANKVIRNAGPTEFINLFANAEKVITTSFHGTCFSILFEKDFYSLINSGREVRINNLLNKFKLTERMISNDLPISMENKKIDFSYSRTLLELEREKSKEFLLKITGTHNE